MFNKLVKLVIILALALSTLSPPTFIYATESETDKLYLDELDKFDEGTLDGMDIIENKEDDSVYFDLEIEVDYEVNTQGLTMNPEEFLNAFTGEVGERFVPFNLESTNLSLGNIAINGANVKLDMILRPANLFGEVVNVDYDAYVTRLNGNQNDLTITVIEHFIGGGYRELTETYRINNNGSGTFSVGDYQIFVNTQGNTQIREIRLESDGTTVLPIEGKIFNGNREESAFVIDVPDLVNGYEVILFEINTAPQQSNLLLPQSHFDGLSSEGHVKIYLQDEAGYIHIFETEIPEVFTILNSNDFTLIEDGMDVLWAFRFLDIEYEDDYEDIDEEYLDLSEIEDLLPYLDDPDLEDRLPEGVEIVPSSTQLGSSQLNRSFRINGSTRQATMDVGVETHTVFVRPVYILDISTSITPSAGEWTITLAMEQWAERYNSRGAFLGTVVSPGYFEFRNWNLFMSVGNFTRFRQQFLVTSVRRRREPLTPLNIAARGAAVGARIFTDTNSKAWTIVTNISKLILNREVVQGNPDNIPLTNNPKTIVYASRNGNYFMSRNAPANLIGTSRGIADGNFVSMTGRPRNMDPSRGVDSGRTGRIRFEFDFYTYRGVRLGRRTMNRHFNYTLRP